MTSSDLSRLRAEQVNEAQWTLIAFVNCQYPRYSKKHLVFNAPGEHINGRTLCGFYPPLMTHHGHNYEGRCVRCFGRAKTEGIDLDDITI